MNCLKAVGSTTYSLEKLNNHSSMLTLYWLHKAVAFMKSFASLSAKFLSKFS